jgi:hypothetical protein
MTGLRRVGLWNGPACASLRAGTKRAQTCHAWPVPSDTGRHGNPYSAGKSESCGYPPVLSDTAGSALVMRA